MNCLVYTLFPQTIVKKSSKENLKVIKNTLPSRSGNPENFKKESYNRWKCGHSWEVFGEGVLQVVLFKDFCFKWLVKKHMLHLLARDKLTLNDPNSRRLKYLSIFV